MASRFGKPILDAISDNGPLGYDWLAADGWQCFPRDVALRVLVFQVVDVVAAQTYTLCGKFMLRCQTLLLNIQFAQVDMSQLGRI